MLDDISHCHCCRDALAEFHTELGITNRKGSGSVLDDLLQPVDAAAAARRERGNRNEASVDATEKGKYICRARGNEQDDAIARPCRIQQTHRGELRAPAKLAVRDDSCLAVLDPNIK